MHETESSEIRMPQSARRTLRLRLRVWWRRQKLTAELAEGRGPDSSDELRLVANDLIGTRAQRRLADALDKIVRATTGPARPWSARMPLHRREILAAHGELRAVAERLRAGGPVPVHAVALAAVLVLDGSGPIYSPTASRSVATLAREARESFDDPIT